jgi:hypothetical protein
VRQKADASNCLFLPEAVSGDCQPNLRTSRQASIGVPRCHAILLADEFVAGASAGHGCGAEAPGGPCAGIADSPQRHTVKRVILGQAQCSRKCLDHEVPGAKKGWGSCQRASQLPQVPHRSPPDWGFAKSGRSGIYLARAGASRLWVIASMSRLPGRSRIRPGLDRSKAAVATRDGEARRPRAGVRETFANAACAARPAYLDHDPTPLLLLGRRSTGRRTSLPNAARG